MMGKVGVVFVGKGVEDLGVWVKGSDLGRGYYVGKVDGYDHLYGVSYGGESLDEEMSDFG
jgi:hypothetical protein